MTEQPETNSAEPASVGWHAMPWSAVASQLEVGPKLGLSPPLIRERRNHEGPNRLLEHKEEPWWEEVFESLTEPLQLLLIAVAAVYFWLGEKGDAITILAVILVVAAIEVFSELRAKRAVAALSTLAAPNATVIRDGQPREIPAEELVRGDVVLLGPGARVPADLRLVESVALRTDESSLTGESAPVAKDADAQIDARSELGDRVTMAYAGTVVTAGKGRGLVVATGTRTEIGRIAGLMKEAREPRTPLQEALGQLSRWLLWVAIGFSVLVPVLGILVADRPPKEMLLVGLTLAFATIPEELPILITIVLGLGAFRLAKRNAIVKRLRAAETLGSVSVVATDKTGTLTQNRMRVATVVIGEREMSVAAAAGLAAGRELLTMAVLANDAQTALGPAGVQFIGDPTETALLSAAEQVGLAADEIRRAYKVVEEYPFSDDRKRMSVLVEAHGQRLLAAKGSPESILAVCTSLRNDGADHPLNDADREAWRQRAQEMAGRGLRMLAIAQSKPLGLVEILDVDAAEKDLVLLGFAALNDPPRAEAAGAVKALRAAGVRVLMVTGDHPATARAIASQVGIDADAQPVRGLELEGADDAKWAVLVRQTSVFARSTPEHKLRIVRALQGQGEIVAVTGDGVNDGPALREAAIGVAMGRAGSDVAREAADLILADDNFATVTEAVRTGRVLYANLSKAVRYYLAAKVALVSASLAAVLLKLPVPFEPVQIIMMELFMDLGASVTFVAEPAEEDVMARPPRDAKRPFMDRTMQAGIIFGGLSLGAAVLVGYLGSIHLGASMVQAQTAAFAAWMIGHVVLAANMRAERQPLLRTHPLANRPFLIWAALAIGLLPFAQAVAPVQHQLHLAGMTTQMWLLVVAAAVLLPSWWELWKWTQRPAKFSDASRQG